MLKNDNGKIYIKKHTTAEWLTLYIFVMPFGFSFFVDFLRFPDFIKYTVDLAWVTLFALLLFRERLQIRKKLLPFVIHLGVSLLYVSIVYIFNFQSPFYFLWGFRNVFRFYVGFLAFATFFEEDIARACLKFADILFWINAVATFYQFFVLGITQDYLGGIFGMVRGCNGYSILFFILIISKSLLSYMDGKEKMWICALKCAISLIISALAELKFFFVIFVIILALATVLTKFSWRKFTLILISVVFLSFANTILTVIFGQNQTLSFDRVIELMLSSSYASTEDLGRFTAIPAISKTILTDISDKLFGMGLGNCDTSAFALCNTPFYQIYEGLHYYWFNSAFLFLETGYIGLALYLSFFVLSFFAAYKGLKSGTGNTLFCQLAIIFSLMCIILTFYNATLRRDYAFMAYFVMALPLMATLPNASNRVIDKFENVNE